jgi:ElaB/YqjD/DUF883 family membrane-anchored ribosome-binding protein
MEQEPNQKGAALEVYDKLEETAETLRERAVQLKTQLADRLETGASKLRQRSSDTASGMEKSAEWLRDTNMSTIKQGLARQVKENPGRTLLIAGAIGYLLGRAFKGKDA